MAVKKSSISHNPYQKLSAAIFTKMAAKLVPPILASCYEDNKNPFQGFYAYSIVVIFACPEKLLMHQLIKMISNGPILTPSDDMAQIYLEVMRKRTLDIFKQKWMVCMNIDQIL